MHFVYVEADGSIRMSKGQFERVARDAYEEGYEKGKKECEATHDAIYDDGYKAGYNAALNNTTSNPNFITPTITCTCEDDKCTCDNEKNHDKIVKTNIPAIHATYTVTPEQAKKLSEQVSELFGANSISTVNDVFTNLKKELGL